MCYSPRDNSKLYQAEIALREYVADMNFYLISLRHNLFKVQKLSNQLNPNNERIRNAIDTLSSLTDEVELSMPMLIVQADQYMSFRRLLMDVSVVPYPSFRRRNKED